mgnify:FL=1
METVVVRQAVNAADVKDSIRKLVTWTQYIKHGKQFILSCMDTGCKIRSPSVAVPCCVRFVYLCDRQLKFKVYKINFHKKHFSIRQKILIESKRS